MDPVLATILGVNVGIGVLGIGRGYWSSICETWRTTFYQSMTVSKVENPNLFFALTQFLHSQLASEPPQHMHTLEFGNGQRNWTFFVPSPGTHIELRTQSGPVYLTTLSATNGITIDAYRLSVGSNDKTVFTFINQLVHALGQVPVAFEMQTFQPRL